MRRRTAERAWVEREEVVDSPADFSSMSDEIIRGLSGRGEASPDVFSLPRRKP